MTVTGGRAGVATGPGRPPRSRGAKITRRLVITLVVVLVVLVAADFGAAAIFEYQVSKKAREQFGLKDNPSVTVAGFPFLTQAVGGTYDHVTIDANGVPIKDTLQDVQVHADLYGVHAPLSDLASGTNNITVDRVEGQVRVKAADVNRAVQAKQVPGLSDVTNLSIDPISREQATAGGDAGQGSSDAPGKTAGVKLCGSIGFAGQSTDVCVSGLIVLDGSRISIRPRHVDVRNSLLDGPLADGIQSQILQRFAITLDPGVLPFKVTPTAVQVDTGTLALSGKAEHVALNSVRG